MEVVRNEPSCYNAACHQHSQDKPVLGVLDIVYSLDETDRELRASTLGIAGFSLGFIVIASLSVGFFVHRLVYLPLRDLEGGAQRLSAGNLDQPIPVRSNDEFGRLAASFNAMTNALRNSRAELRDWATYARAESGKTDAGAAPRSGGDRARGEARLGRAAGLGRRP